MYQWQLYAVSDNIERIKTERISAEGGTPIAQPAPAVAILRTVAPRPRPLAARGVWRGRSLRAQLLVIFVLIDVAALVLGGGIAVVRARAQTRVEMAASIHLAEALVGDAAALAHQQLSAEQFLANLPLQLRSIRHVRIEVKDEAGVPIRGTPSTDVGAGRGAAPRWFAQLVAPPVDVRDVPVVINGSKVGEVEIAGEPGDEIAEFWENAAAMAGTVTVLNMAMLAILYVLFGRVLGPLTALAEGLSDLKRQTYDVRMPNPQARELAAITEHFNALAGALETARTENLALNRQLITAQDDERRRTALELHDEVGPCLFGLKANASSIATAAALPEADRRAIAARLHDSVAIIDHLQAINRSMLERLRPMALGHVPLNDMLGELVHEQERRHAHISFRLSAAHMERSYGDSIDLTLYRCLQESLTNAVRHAQARHVTISLHAESERMLVLTVRDDGCGIHPGKVAGFGLRGMQERVEGLGGRYTIDSEPGNGTCVRVTLPLAEAGNVGSNADERGATAS
jgi:two-component system, NarL family, sensor histidine kinase UhpB